MYGRDIIDYFKSKKETTEKNLTQAGLIKCKKCGVWIGNNFSDKKGNCDNNCIR